MEQVENDRVTEKNRGLFEKDTEDRLDAGVRQIGMSLRSVMCEVKSGLISMRAEISEDVTRGIMSQDVRNAEDKLMRDWVIYREYMNQLEYMIEVLEAVKDAL